MKEPSLRTLTLDFDPRGIATLCPAQDVALHAFDASFVHELSWAVAVVAADPRIRVAMLALQPRLLPPVEAAVSESGCETTAYPSGRELASLLEMIDEGGKPFIAMVGGFIAGDAAALCCACDAVLSLPDSMFALGPCGPEAAGDGSLALMPWLVATLGRRAAQQLVLTAEVFDTARALQLQLLTETASLEDLPCKALRMAEAMLAHPPSALEAARRAFRAAPVPLPLTAMAPRPIQERETPAETIDLGWPWPAGWDGRMPEPLLWRPGASAAQRVRVSNGRPT